MLLPYLRLPAFCIGIIAAAVPPVAIADDDASSSSSPHTIFKDSDFPAFVFGENDYVLFPDGDRLFFGDPELVLEAQAAPDFRFLSNIAAATQDIFTLHKGQNCPTDNRPLAQRRCFRRQRGRSVFGTILLRMRMYRNGSNPVRTPSFMPKVTAQWVTFRSLLDPYSDDDIEPVGSTVHVTATTLVGGHYSNGQEGCLFELAPHEKCESVTAWADKTINTHDGSFSTHYVRLGRYWGWMTIGDATNDVVTKQKGFGLAVEYHPCRGCDGGGWMEQPLRSLYGDVHITAAFDYAKARVWRFQRLETRIGLNLVANCRECEQRYSLTVEVFAQPRWWNGPGYYLRIDNGRDYYNTAFERYRKRVTAGIAFNLGKFFSFPL